MNTAQYKVFKLYGQFYKNSGKICIAVGAGLLCKNLIQQVFPQQYCLGYYGSMNVELEEVGYDIKLLSKCCRDMNVNGTKITPFVAETLDVVSSGIYALGSNHCVVGIPRTFYCDYMYEVLELKMIQEMRKKLSNKKELKEPNYNETALMKSLVLSENAQKFVVSTHLLYLKQNWPLYKAVIPSSFVLLAYLGISSSFKLFSVGKKVNFFLAIGFGMLSIISSCLLCKFSKGVSNYKMLRDLDVKVASVSKEYAQGGVDFYTSLLERNKAIRVLLGQKGEKYITVYGNVIDGLIFNKHGPLYTDRVTKLKEICNEHEAL